MLLETELTLLAAVNTCQVTELTLQRVKTFNELVAGAVVDGYLIVGAIIKKNDHCTCP